MTKKFDPTKPVQTRDGRSARIICTDRKTNGWPIVALVERGDGSSIEDLCCYKAEGGYIDGSAYRDWGLVNVPERTSVFINLFSPEQSSMFVWPSRESADETPSRARRALLQIIYENGIPVNSIIHPVNQEEK